MKEQKNALEQMIDAYKQIAEAEELPKEVGLALYAMLAEQLPEGQRSGLYAGLSLGYAKLAEELEGQAKQQATALSQLYLTIAANQYQSIIQAKQNYTPLTAQPYKAEAKCSTKAA